MVLYGNLNVCIMFKSLKKLKAICDKLGAIDNVLGRAQKQTLSNQFKRNTGTIITDLTVISNEFNDFFFIMKHW